MIGRVQGHQATGASRRTANTLAVLRIALTLLMTIAIAASLSLPAIGQTKPITICPHQRYALCATASCLAYNDVAYCKCDVQFGDSISESDTIPQGDICTLNREGYANGYMMSTYSLPKSVLAGGSKAIYTCAGASVTGAYAQCDGGVCFNSTRGRHFPGFSQRLRADEIICSCPITVADPSANAGGYQIVGPYPCQESFFDNCSSAVANTDTGSTVFVGAPTGSPRILTRLLDGSVPPLNYCFPSR